MLETLPITIIVHTKNSAETLETCLQSLPKVAELLVVDMGSTDQTLTIAKEFQAKVISVADVDHVEPARNVAIATATQPWILIVDADEELPTEANDWLPELLEVKEHTIFALPRRNIVFGRPLEYTGWWPDYQVRFFRKGTVSWSDKIHSQPECQHQPFQLPANDTYALIHHNYQHIAQFIERMNRYTSIEALSADGKDTGQWLLLYSGELLARLFAQEGWKDKEQGLAISLLQALYPVLTVLKRWDARGFPSEPHFEVQLGQQLKQFSQEVAYWHATYQIVHSGGLHRLYWQIRRKLQL